MVALNVHLLAGLREQLCWGSSVRLRNLGLVPRGWFGACPRIAEVRDFHSDQSQRQDSEGMESEASSAGRTALSSGGPYAARLSSRKVIRFDGPEVTQFLQVCLSIRSLLSR